MLLSYQISLKLSEKFCFVHNMGISTFMSADTAVVKVCCRHFRDEVEGDLKKHFADAVTNHQVRLQLPAFIEGAPMSYAEADE
jgi:hypothetical protein